MIRDEDGPEVPVRYVRHADCLTMDVGPSPGAVEIVLYRVTADAASLDGQNHPLGETPGGQRVRLAGRAGAEIEFRLER